MNDINTILSNNPSRPDSGSLFDVNEIDNITGTALTYKAALEELSSQKPTTEHIAILEEAKRTGPNYLGRTASASNGFRFETLKFATNGSTSQTLMMPAADTHPDQALHDSLYDLTQGELVYMVGQHLIWNDIRGDEFLSYSKDLLFLVVHALDRYHDFQSNVTIQLFDRRKAVNVKGEPAAFYPALKVYEAFKVPSWTGWTDYNQIQLHSRIFTQEYLSHGTILVKDTRFQQVPIETLIRDGLYDIFPAFQVPDDHLRAGLYTGQVVFRKAGYPPGEPVRSLRYPRIYSYKRCAREVPFTTQLLKKVQKLTGNFTTLKDFNDSATCEPHLHIFLSFLTFEKRPKRDAVFLGWIQTHYSADDVTDLYYDGTGGVQRGFTDVADNLLGVMQYLDLVRDAAFAFGLLDLPAKAIETKNRLTGEYYASEDAKQHRKDLPSSKYDRDAQLDKRDKAKRGRKAKKDGKAASAVLVASEIDGSSETENIRIPDIVTASNTQQILEVETTPELKTISQPGETLTAIEQPVSTTVTPKLYEEAAENDTGDYRNGLAGSTGTKSDEDIQEEPIDPAGRIGGTEEHMEGHAVEEEALLVLAL